MNAQITNFTGSLWAGLTAAFTSFMNFIPALLGALVILVAGWFIAKLVGAIVERILMSIKLETVVEKAHISDYLPQTDKGTRPKLSTFVGLMTKWFIFMIFIQAAAITLGVAQLTGLISSIILFLPNIVVAVVILVVGAWAARFVSELVEKSTSKMNIAGSNTITLLSRYGILGFSVIAAVSQLGIATNLINILFTGLVAFLALAFGLAFGLGGQSVASDITRSWFEKSSYVTGSPTPKNINNNENAPFNH